MDLITEDVSPGLVRYLRILSRGSNKFGEAAVAFKEKCFDKGRSEIIEKELNEILKQFFIPVKESNISYLLGYIYGTGISTKCTININMLATDSKPASIKINEPSVIVHITDKMTTDEWLELGSEVTKFTDKLEKPDYLKRKWTNMDLLLEIYRCHKVEGYSLARLHKDIVEIKKRVGFKKNTVYGMEEIRKLLHQIIELVDSI